MEFILAMGVPTAITGLMVWLLKRSIEKHDKLRDISDAQREEERKQREDNIKEIMLYIMRTGRANNVLAEATARAVQRIPDAKCNGDMTAALQEAESVLKEEHAFLMSQGVDHIFGQRRFK